MGLYEESLLLEEEIMDEPEMVLVRRQDLHLILWFESDGSRAKEWQEAWRRLVAVEKAALMSKSRAKRIAIQKGGAEHG